MLHLWKKYCYKWISKTIVSSRFKIGRHTDRNLQLRHETFAITFYFTTIGCTKDDRATICAFLRTARYYNTNRIHLCSIFIQFPYTSRWTTSSPVLTLWKYILRRRPFLGTTFCSSGSDFYLPGPSSSVRSTSRMLFSSLSTMLFSSSAPQRSSGKSHCRELINIPPAISFLVFSSSPLPLRVLMSDIHVRARNHALPFTYSY